MPRGPLPFLLALEAIVLVALAFFGWRLVTDRLGPAPSPPPTAVARLPLATPRPAVRASTSPAVPATVPSTSPAAARSDGPALSVDPVFWGHHLSQVNRDEGALEALEWRVVQAVEGFARAYIDAVVIPAAENARDRNGR